MPKKRIHRRDGYIAPHVRLHWWVMKSDAWGDLKPTDRALLVELYSHFNGTNNGIFFLSVRDAAKAINVAPNTALKAFRRLIDHGFIRPAQVGAFSLKSRHATTWILTEFGYRDALPTKDFMTWVKPAIKQNPVLKFATDGIKICDRDVQKRAA